MMGTAFFYMRVGTKEQIDNKAEKNDKSSAPHNYESPMNERLYPFEVLAFLDRVEARAADMGSFTPGEVSSGDKDGEPYISTHVYARDKDDAILLAASLNPVSHEDVQAWLDERRRAVMNTSYMPLKSEYPY